MLGFHFLGIENSLLAVTDRLLSEDTGVSLYCDGEADTDEHGVRGLATTGRSLPVTLNEYMI